MVVGVSQRYGGNDGWQFIILSLRSAKNISHAGDTAADAGGNAHSVGWAQAAGSVCEVH